MLIAPTADGRRADVLDALRAAPGILSVEELHG